MEVIILHSTLFNQINITTDTDPTLFSKPIIMLNISNIIYAIAITYMTYSAIKFRYTMQCIVQKILPIFFSKVSGIPRRQQNILEIKCQCIYNYLMLFCMSLDQFKNHYLEVHYNTMSKDQVFELWTSAFIIENIGKKFVNGTAKDI